MTKKETFGATTEEKWEIAYYLFVALAGISAFSILAVATFVENALFSLVLLPALGLVGIAVFGIYNHIEMIALRIRLEESAHLSEVINKIVAIYREGK